MCLGGPGTWKLDACAWRALVLKAANAPYLILGVKSWRALFLPRYRTVPRAFRIQAE